MILKVNRSHTQSNVTFDVYGVDCNTVQDMPVICEKKKGMIFCKIINFILRVMKLKIDLAINLLLLACILRICTDVKSDTFLVNGGANISQCKKQS